MWVLLSYLRNKAPDRRRCFSRRQDIFDLGESLNHKDFILLHMREAVVVTESKLWHSEIGQ